MRLRIILNILCINFNNKHKKHIISTFQCSNVHIHISLEEINNYFNEFFSLHLIFLNVLSSIRFNVNLFHMFWRGSGRVCFSIFKWWLCVTHRGYSRRLGLTLSRSSEDSHLKFDVCGCLAWAHSR